MNSLYDAMSAYFARIAEKKEIPYEYNQEKAENILKISSVIDSMRDLKFKVNRVVVDPRYKQGVIELVFYDEAEIEKRHKEQFCEVIKLCDGLNIKSNPVTETAQITFFVNDLWKNSKNVLTSAKKSGNMLLR